MLPERADAVPQAFYAMAERRRRGESIAHIRGFREFFGREFLVNDDVLSPRQDTEVLVEAALEMGDARMVSLVKTGEASLSVLDMCTGSGAVAISIAAERRNWRVSASDISPAAIKIAEQNAHRLLASSQVSFIESDLFPTLVEHSILLWRIRPMSLVLRQSGSSAMAGRTPFSPSMAGSTA